MCGAAMLAQPQVDKPASSPAPAQPTPAITGPSLLGLNTPSASSESHASANANANEGREPSISHPASQNLDYLLEDDEEPKQSGGKWLLLAVALLLALGFGYLRWKQGGFAWIDGSPQKPAAAQSSDANPETTASTTKDSTTAQAPPAQAAPQTAAPSSSNPSNPPSQDTAARNTPSANLPAQNPPAQNVSEQNAPQQGASTQPAASTSVPAAAPPIDNSAPAGAEPAAAVPDAGKRKPSKHMATPAEPKPSRKEMARKPAPSKPLDPVTEATHYIYGQGVEQDCDRGLRMLKAAGQSNAKAMIQLGVLYSTGTCTPRDLPTAYRWFALALHRDPDNKVLQEDLQKLWAQMTPPERQLAIKLSQ